MPALGKTKAIIIIKLLSLYGLFQNLNIPIKKGKNRLEIFVHPTPNGAELSIHSFRNTDMMEVSSSINILSESILKYVQ
jgi:hypothetical protein